MSGWLLRNVRYLAALQDVIDRAGRPRPSCGVCGEPVVWNRARTRLHHWDRLDRSIIDHEPTEASSGDNQRRDK